MWHRRAVLAGMASVLAAPQVLAESSVTGGLSKTRLKAAEALALQFLQLTGSPGLSVAYAREGKFHYVAAFGRTGSGAESLDPGHRMRIASVSKPITASAILVLAEAGKLSRDDKVFGAGGLLDKRFPLPKTARHMDWLAAITVDHLLTHTAGGWSNESNDPMFRDPSLSQDEVIRAALLDTALQHAPGTSYAYSNFGYCLLGRVIEEVTGQTYANHVKASILGPSDATSMAIGASHLDGKLPMEVEYLGQGGQDPYGMNIERMDSHGGWVATAADLVRFGMHVDGYKSVKDLLSKKSVAISGTASAAFAGYGRGWAVNPNHRNKWHNGSLPGTTSILVRVDGGDCFAGLVNSRQGNADTGAALDTLMWAIYGEVFA